MVGKLAGQPGVRQVRSAVILYVSDVWSLLWLCTRLASTYTQFMVYTRLLRIRQWLVSIACFLIILELHKCKVVGLVIW